MKHFLYAILLLTTANLYGQIRIQYLKNPGEPTLKEIRANCHFTKTKLSDSGWIVHQYDMRDTLMMTGTYKDEQMHFPDGKFKYYDFQEPVNEIRYDYMNHKSDMTFVPGKSYLNSVGFFSNGEKTGIWHLYAPTGKLTVTETYEHDKLNGPYTTHTDSGYVLIRGNYVNDKRNGNWDMLSPKGEVIRTDVFKKGDLVKSISHLNEPKFRMDYKGGNPPYNFIKYLNSALSKKEFTVPAETTVRYSFDLDKFGKLISPSASQPGSLEIDTAIIDVILAAPNWKPLYINGQLAEGYVSIGLDIVIYDDKHIKISQKQLSNDPSAVSGFNTAKEIMNTITAGPKMVPRQ